MSDETKTRWFKIPVKLVQEVFTRFRDTWWLVEIEGVGTHCVCDHWLKGEDALGIEYRDGEYIVHTIEGPEVLDLPDAVLEQMQEMETDNE